MHLFDESDMLIDTDNDGWSLIMANAKGRQAIDALIDRPINWDFSDSRSSPSMPPDWSAIDIDLKAYIRHDYATRVPKVNASPRSLRTSLRLGCGALNNTPDLRVVVHDDRTGWRRLNLEHEQAKALPADSNVIDFAAVRSQLHTPPEVKLENGIIVRGRGVLDPIVANNKPELVTSDVGASPSLVPSDHDLIRAEMAGRGVHLFELTSSLCEAVQSTPAEARRATLEGMAQMDLLHLPYPEIAVRFTVTDVMPSLLEKRCKGMTMTLRAKGRLDVCSMPNRTAEPCVTADYNDAAFLERPHEPLLTLRLSSDAPEVGLIGIRPLVDRALTILVLALASRNVVKRDRLAGAHKKQARGLQAGPLGAVYVSRTVLELPDRADMDAEPGAHNSPRPHLRRGHVHTIRFGKNWSERRRTWFEPVFVNDNPEFVVTPRGYILSE